MDDLELIIDKLDVAENSPVWRSASGPFFSQEQGLATPAPMAYVGVAIMVWLSFLRPFEWVSAIYALHVAYLLGVLSLLTIALFVFGGYKPKLSSELKLLLLLVGQLCLATPFAHWRGGAFTIIFHNVTIIALMSVAVGLTANSLDRIMGIIRIEAISLSVLTAVALLDGVRDSEGRLVGIGSTFRNSNDLATILAVSVPFCIMFLFATKGTVLKLFWACSGAMMVYAISRTLSRSGLISLVVGVFICLWNLSKERRRGALALLVLIVISIVTMVASSPSFRERLSAISGNSPDTTVIAASAGNSSLSRQKLLLRAIGLMLHHPLLGVGPGNFVAISGGQYGDWFVSHNTYTQCGAEAGLPALLMFVLMLSNAVKHCKGIQKRPGVSADAKTLAIAMRASLLAYAVAAFFADTAYQFFPYFLVVVAGALWQIEAVQPDLVPEQPASLSDAARIQDAVSGLHSWRNEWV